MVDLIDRLGGFSSSTAVKGPCRAATTGNITLRGYQTIDGEVFDGAAFTAGKSMRLLVRAQADARANGLYLVRTTDWKRTKDFDNTGDFIEGTQIHVHSGDTLSGVWAVTSPDTVVLESSNIIFALVASAVAPSYRVAFVPDATVQAGQIIFANDEIEGPVLAFSDGINWRRVTDRAVISYIFSIDRVLLAWSEPVRSKPELHASLQSTFTIDPVALI